MILQFFSVNLALIFTTSLKEDKEQEYQAPGASVLEQSEDIIR
jgi:hypothetical protein